MHIGELKVPCFNARKFVIGLVALFAVNLSWTCYWVPTRSRGVVTQFGKWTDRHHA